MKTQILALVGFILLFLVPQFSFASTVSGEISIIQKKIGSDYAIRSYDISRLDKDIASQESEWWDELPEYSIQRFSKDPTWNKKRFVEFVNYLKSKNTKKAVELFKDNQQVLDVFSPTCCASTYHFAFKPMKNGFASIEAWTQWGWIQYNMSYTYFKDNKVFKITQPLPFRDFIIEDQKRNKEIFWYCPKIDYKKPDLWCLWIKYGEPENYSWMPTEKDIGWPILKRYLEKPESNKQFKKLYDTFVSNLNKLWE